jgi:crotonobetainyl-CoA:carnitine CoA-transferase CaiB-like acyl-CoA transferase
MALDLKTREGETGPMKDRAGYDQVLAEEMVTTFEHPLVGRYRGQSRSVKFIRTPGPESFAAPSFGQHSDSVLEELGFSAEERQQLRDKIL